MEVKKLNPNKKPAHEVILDRLIVIAAANPGDTTYDVVMGEVYGHTLVLGEMIIPGTVVLNVIQRLEFIETEMHRKGESEFPTVCANYVRRTIEKIQSS